MIQASFRVVAPAEKRKEVLYVLMCLKGPTEVARGCQGCRILQDADNENVLTYLGRWDTLEDVEEHLRSERFRRLLPYIELSVEAPEVEFATIQKVHGIELLVAALGSEISE